MNLEAGSSLRVSRKTHSSANTLSSTEPTQTSEPQICGLAKFVSFQATTFVVICYGSSRKLIRHLENRCSNGHTENLSKFREWFSGGAGLGTQVCLKPTSMAYLSEAEGIGDRGR